MPADRKDAGPIPRYAWVIAAVAVLVVTGALGFARFGYTVILPSMKQALGLGDAQAGDLATGNLLGYLASSLVCGLLAARFGPRVVVSVSLVFVAAGLVVTGLARSFSVALLGRIVTGMASGGANVPVMGLVAAWFPARRRGLATGIAVSGSSFGLLVTGAAIPPILVAYGGAGWSVSWFFLAGATLLVALVAAAAARNSPSAPTRTAGSEERPGMARILASRRIWALGGIYVLFGFSYIIYSTFFVRHLTAAAGLTIQEAGALWSGVGLVSVSSGFLWGTVSDRLGRKHALVMVFLLQSASFALLGLWAAPAGYLLSAALFALTAWSIPAIMAALAGDLVGARLAPGALGFLTVLFGVGQAAGPFVAGRIAERSGSYATAFVIAGAAALAGALGSLALRGRRSE